MALGSLEDVRAALPGEPEIDLGGAVVHPGLIDAHGHLLGLGQTLVQLDLSQAESTEDLAAQVAAEVDRRPRGSWIVGMGWDQTRFPGGAFPDRALLDKVCPNNPVLLLRVDAHAALANAAALNAAGFRRETPDPPGGRLLRRPDGELSGLLIDTAAEKVWSLVPAPDDVERERLLLSACRHCRDVGLVEVHDAGMDLASFKVLERLAARGELPIRVYAMARFDLPGFDELVAQGPRMGEWLSLRTVKVLLDGALGSWGAALFDDYSDDPGNRGLLLAGEDLADRLRPLAARGFQLALHAIGDRANALALDLLESLALPRDSRPRVEHAQVLRASDLPRLVRLGAIASMQPTHAVSDWRFAGDRLGEQRLRFAYAWRALLEAGVPLAFGSDFPIEAANPIAGLGAAALWRPGGSEASRSLTRAQALAAFTSGAAFAAFEEGRAGRIEIGGRADFSCFDRDLLSCPDAELAAVRPVLTVVNGQLSWARV